MMERSRKGGMKKVDELKLSGKEDYSQCISKVLDRLSIDIDESHEEASLFRLNGSKVLNEPIIDDDSVEHPWMLATYLGSIYQKATQFKLGVGVTEVSYHNLVG